ncbi:MAG: YihA family ribosome biosis GTP-binding protein [Verrucomicrobia bacterium]|nr:YihA family ribosome biosis GTP-binding protein [Verrucomicrobiota bacterium]
MKIKSAVFERSSPDLRSCPQWARPEFALIGRSNVGKSSLINLLAGRRDLAKVSDLPGKTQLINFFLVNGTWMLVDLPGYGYASVGEQRRLGFNEAVADFLSKRENLRLVFVLIDSRLPPQRIDLDFLRWLEGTRQPYALIFTKTDKQSALKGRANMDAFIKAMGEWRSVPPALFATSSKNRTGQGEILNAIEQALAESRQG